MKIITLILGSYWLPTIALLMFSIIIIIENPQIRSAFIDLPAWSGSLLGALIAVTGAYILDIIRARREKKKEQLDKISQLEKIATLIGHEIIHYSRFIYYMINRHETIIQNIESKNATITANNNPMIRYFDFYNTDMHIKHKSDSLKFDNNTSNLIIKYFSQIDKIIADGKFSARVQKTTDRRAADRQIAQFAECQRRAESAYRELRKKYANKLPETSKAMQHALELADEDARGAIPENRVI